ncbi:MULTISPECIES: DoxX family membrane protein [unclassified Corynebacterium]|uniref:DoxX family membrane protein n=1 Tax=unclassified Corynebacterium TaxID=2624378 RepID=UPI0029CA0EF1|nr:MULTISPECIES: DoxX family membrane protein [unclassified Corynebacterium]WPF67053.1 DoxX family membrane protein [Corynebacterium sp. 22KM0430]WPF69541.1 DoxX family membrane protein [Corynebacterium sp. 21KM1197]
MSQDSATPDRADKADADDLDIPTFNPATDGPTDPYKKVGRAAPQEIPPRGAAEAPRGEEKPKKPAAPEKKAPEPAKEDKEKDRSAPLLSDAPTTTMERPAAKPVANKSAAKNEKKERETEKKPPKAAPVPSETLTEDKAMPTPAAASAASVAASASSTTRVERPQQPETRAQEAPASSPSAPAYAGAAAPVVDNAEEEETPEVRRGTLDFGLLILRLGLGGWLILHSLSVFFHLGGSAGLSGLEAQYAAYTQPQALAVAIPAASLAAGVFVLLGLITPLFAAAATVVTGFMAADALAHSHSGLDVFSWPDNVWLYMVLGAAAIALQFTGPGRYALDFSRGWARRPLASAWLGLVLAAAGLGALWWFGAGINPLV